MVALATAQTSIDVQGDPRGVAGNLAAGREMSGNSDRRPPNGIGRAAALPRHWAGAPAVLTTPMPAPVLPLTDLPPHLPPRGALIGLDLGTKTIGVATSDPDRRLATGVETVARAPIFPPMRRACCRWRRNARRPASCSGLPINMDGSEGPRAQSTRSFARNLATADRRCRSRSGTSGSPPPLSSASCIAADASRGKRKAVIDQHAAIYILQGALDRLQRMS